MRGWRRPSEVAFMEKIIEGQIATGLSSQHLACIALRLESPRFFVPLDRADFNRCRETYAAAPRHLQRRMKPFMDQWANDLRAAAKNDPTLYRYVNWPAPEIEEHDARL